MLKAQLRGENGGSSALGRIFGKRPTAGAAKAAADEIAVGGGQGLGGSIGGMLSPQDSPPRNGSK